MASDSRICIWKGVISKNLSWLKTPVLSHFPCKVNSLFVIKNTPYNSNIWVDQLGLSALSRNYAYVPLDAIRSIILQDAMYIIEGC